MRPLSTLLALLAACSPPETSIRTLSPEIAVAPEEVLFEPTVVLFSSVGEVFVTNAGQAELEVTLTLDDPAGVFEVAEAELLLEPDTTEPVGILFTPTNFLDYEGYLILDSNDEERPQVQVKLVGTGVDAPMPDIELDQLTLDFGEVAQGSTGLLFFEIRNVGDAPLQLDTLDQTGSGAFVLQSDPSGAIIAPGDDLPVIVMYAPTSEGGDNGRIRFPSNDPDEPEVELLLLGNGGGDLAYPEAVLDCPGQASPPTFVTLDGSGSFDPEGHEPLTYDWRIAGAPANSVVAQFTNPTQPVTDLFLDAAGPYTIELQVTNAIGTRSAPARCDLLAIPEDDIHIELTWDGTNADLDLHLVENDSALFEMPGDCTWCNRAPAWGAAGGNDDPRLDIDDRGGLGPENINVYRPSDGRYHVWVHYFDDHGDFDVTARVKIWLDGVEVWSGSQVMARNEMWEVGQVNWPEATFAEVFDGPARWDGPRSCQ